MPHSRRKFATHLVAIFGTTVSPFWVSHSRKNPACSLGTLYGRRERTVCRVSTNHRRRAMRNSWRANGRPAPGTFLFD
eukprot:15453651-Alexandrium_andersonii.AAC.1